MVLNILEKYCRSEFVCESLLAKHCEICEITSHFAGYRDNFPAANWEKERESERDRERVQERDRKQQKWRDELYLHTLYNCPKNI